MSDLVQRLSTGDHPVTISLRPTASAEALEAALGRGYLLVTFTDTRGGTELGVTIDRDATDLTRADFAHGRGTVILAGTLMLDYVDVRCLAEINVASLSGRGHLAPVAQPHPA